MISSSSPRASATAAPITISARCWPIQTTACSKKRLSSGGTSEGAPERVLKSNDLPLPPEPEHEPTVLGANSPSTQRKRFRQVSCQDRRIRFPYSIGLPSAANG